ncbi:MAG: hypothetical protein JXI43_12875, partial [Tissierellales bacterium]|nr:hypothetical protein [Tissierellales bacterium]
YFALHEDELSYLVYDIQFYLYTNKERVRSTTEYLKIYPSIIAFGNGEFSTGGYGPSFVENWLKKRISHNQISEKPSRGLIFSKDFENEFMIKLKEYTK